MYTGWYVYASPNLQIRRSLPFPSVPACPFSMSALCLYSCPVNRFICTIFPRVYPCVLTCSFFSLFLTYFILYDRFWVHPHLCKWPNFISFHSTVSVYPSPLSIHPSFDVQIVSMPGYRKYCCNEIVVHVWFWITCCYIVRRISI